MKSVTHSIFKTFLLSMLVVAQMHFAYAQTASILPPAKTTFLDANGKPLTAGTVESFIPATTTHKTTWQDAAETIPNANPLTLDAAGRTLLLGSGSYRQLVKDRLGNVIWDQVTSSTGSGGGGGTASTGDGDVVGTIKPWAGMTAPNQYQFTAGQELSRTTFSALFTAITSTQAVFCNSGSPILNGLSDTTNFWIGMTVELSCVAPGFTTVISKTATTVTLAVNSNVTTNTNAVFFPWGRGNGSTTFNMPDFRGFAIAGNNNMGGIASANLTTAFFGSQTPNAIGAAGGNQSVTLLSSNLSTLNSTISGIAVSNGPLTINGNAFNGGCVNATGGCTGGAQADFMITTTGSTSVGPSSSSVSVSSQGTISSLTGGIAVSATIGSVGSGYTNGAQTITIAGGTCTIQPQFTVTIAGNIFTGSPVLLTAGSCTVVPNNPAATTGGGGTGGTLNVVYSAQPFSTLQPTKTSNYIIKVTPDTVSTVTVGVTSLGSMTGDIACGTSLLCTGNNISVISGNFIPSSAAPVFPSQIFSATGIASGHFIPWLDENVQFSGNGITPFGMFNTNPIIIGASGSTIGSSTVGQTFSVRFTSTGLTGSPITATYTAIGGDTTATIAAGLCTAINANATLHIPTTELPIFCQSFAGSATFNIQWQASLAPSGATPLTLASIGTGTVNIAATVDQLDYTVVQVARLASGRTTPLNGDNLNCFVFTGSSTAGFDTQYGQICVNSPLVTSGAQQGLIQFNAASGSNIARPIFYAEKGLVLFDASHVQATAGDQGFGTINIPATGAYYFAALPAISSTGIIVPGSNVFGGIGAANGLNLQSTQNGAPSGDFVEITAGNKIGYKFDGVTSTFGTSGSLLGNIGFVNLTSGIINLQATTGALGTVTQTLQARTGTVALNGAATVQVFTSGVDQTYTKPANVVWIEIELMGGGGGGAGSGTTPGAATAGGNTCLRASGTACTTPLYQAGGGALGSAAGATQVAGGVVTGSATCSDTQPGGTGGAGGIVANSFGGTGGMSRYGGSGLPGFGGANNATAAATNSGSGGGGSGENATANAGGGGGGGAWCYVVIPSPAATYTYTIGTAGAAGTAGTGGNAGGAGAAGKIRFIEHYN